MIVRNAAAMKRHAWAFPFELVMAVSLLVFAWAGQYGNAGITLFLLAACLALPIIEHLSRVRLAPLLHVSYVGFLFASLFAGEVLGMYSVIPAWDDGLHFASGLLTGLGGIVWLITLVDRRLLKAPAWLLTGMVIALGGLVAVVWELIEFISDQWLGTFMQRNDLFDTMTDFAYGMLGALIMAGLFSRYLQRRRSWGIGRVIAWQRRANN